MFLLVQFLKWTNRFIIKFTLNDIIVKNKIETEQTKGPDTFIEKEIRLALTHAFTAKCYFAKSVSVFCFN